jgi:hypothetical protein
MITITEDNQIDRDGEVIGSIIDGIAWMKAKPAPRIVGQIRQAAGIAGLTFEVADAPTDKECLTVEPISTPQLPGTDSAMEPPANCDDLAGGILSDPPCVETVTEDVSNEALPAFCIGFDWGVPGTQYFARCFVNSYGNDAYSQFCKANGI